MIESFFSRITQTQALFIGFILCGLYFLGAYDDGSRLTTQKSAMDTESSQMSVEIANMSRTIDQAKAYEQLAQEKGQKFLELTKYLPRDFERKDQMKLIANEARAAALEPSLSESGSSGAAKKLQFYEEQEVDANIKGTFVRLMVFLSNLTKSNRVLGVRSLNVQTEGSRNFADGTDTRSPTLNIQIKFVGYRYTGEAEKK